MMTTLISDFGFQNWIGINVLPPANPTRDSERISYMEVAEEKAYSHIGLKSSMFPKFLSAASNVDLLNDFTFSKSNNDSAREISLTMQHMQILVGERTVLKTYLGPLSLWKQIEILILSLYVVRRQARAPQAEPEV